MISKKHAKVYLTIGLGKIFNSWYRPEKAKTKRVNRINCLTINDNILTGLVYLYTS
ncbi:MAG: hypothetical protein Tsb0033_01170 [Winogradskyella sp.]